MIGEIVEVAASEEMPLMPGQILTLAEAALQNPELARDLTPAAFASVIINKPNGESNDQLDPTTGHNTGTNRQQQR